MKLSKKKFCAFLMTAAMAATALTGCGDEKEPEGNSGSAGGNVQESSNGESGGVQEVSLKVWCPQNQVDSGIMEKQQKAFEAEHPEWKITWITEVVGEDKCQDEVLKDVSAAADVFMFASDQLPSLVEAGAIAQLGGSTEAMVKDENAESVVSTVSVDGKIYAIPFTHNTFFMYYDKSLLDEADVTSIEKILAKETADDVYNYYFESAGGWKLACYYYGAGLSVFGADGADLAAGVDWNNATGVAVTNYLIDLRNNKKCAFDSDITVAELIAEHKLGAWFGGTWEYQSFHDVLGDDLGFTTIPTFNLEGTDHQLLSFYSSKAIGINAQSKNMAAAVAFATYLGNEENQLLRFQMSAQVPTNTKASANEEVLADAMTAVLIDQSNNCSVAQPASSLFSARYWSNAGAIATEIKSGEINKDNVQEKLDTFVGAMTQE